jgi:4-amino-4-deoxy-L-arabinose transferase-like glycosyltransferase
MSKNKQRNILWWSAIFIIIFLTHANHLLNPDEGVVLEGAWNLYNNKHLYFDFFEFIPPGSFYLILGIWKIVGVSYWAAKLASILITFGTAVGIYLSARVIKPSNSNFVAPLIFALASPILVLINHNIYNLFFIVYAVYFMFLALDRQNLKYYGLSGLFSGLAIIFLQQKGLALAAAMILFLFINSCRDYKKWLIYCLGIILTLLPLLLWPLKTIYYNLFIFPLFTYTGVNRITSIWLIITFFIFAVIVYLLVTSKDKKIWLLLTVQFSLLLTTIPLPDYYHLVIATAPLLILIEIVIEKIKLKKSLYAQRVYYYFLFLALILFLSKSCFYLITTYKPSFIRGSYKSLEIINQCPGKYIYIGPFAPNVYFEARKLNATPYPFLITNQNTPAQFDEATKYLKAGQPSCAILNYPSSLQRFGYNKNNSVENYIREKYNLIFFDSTTFIYRLK